MKDSEIINSVRKWVETIVVELNLCPFAKRELVKNRVRFFVSHAETEEQLLLDLATELEFMQNDSSIETTLLIHPDVLGDFYDYNQFLDYVDRLLTQMNYDGIYQIASFHPDYQFSSTLPEDAENYTNKTPYPLLHLLRESSVEKVIEQHSDVGRIPEKNVQILESIGKQEMQRMLLACSDLKNQ
ncbi:MAG: DUF1415 domain-containing protein [Gammaproteobacteria bacterium]